MIRKIIRFLFPKFKNIYYYLNNKIRSNKVSFSAVISKNCQLNYCNIGGYTYIGPNCVLNTVHIGRYSSIGPNVVIGGAEHSYWWYSTSHFLSKENVGGRLTIIGSDVWVRANACIRQGVKIGNGAVIGAGSVVLKDIPPYCIYAGNPAKFIKDRFNDDAYLNQTIKSEYWNFSKKKATDILRNIEKL